MNEHHFEVIVHVDTDGPSLRDLNQENSAYWSQGTVYDTDTDQWIDGKWSDVAGDDEACARLAAVLALPHRIADIYRDNTGEDGRWDIAILEEIAELLAQLGLIE